MECLQILRQPAIVSQLRTRCEFSHGPLVYCRPAAAERHRRWRPAERFWPRLDVLMSSSRSRAAPQVPHGKSRKSRIARVQCGLRILVARRRHPAPSHDRRSAHDRNRFPAQIARSVSFTLARACSIRHAKSETIESWPSFRLSDRFESSRSSAFCVAFLLRSDFYVSGATCALSVGLVQIRVGPDLYNRI